MRPHVELIHESDYMCHPAELPFGQGLAVQRNLSYDEEDGSATLRVDFDSDFVRPSGHQDADVEWFIIAGRMQIGDRELNDGCYFRVPRNQTIPSIRATAGTRVVVFRGPGGSGFVPNGVDANSPVPILIVDSGQIDWQPEPQENNPGQDIKTLYNDADSGANTVVSMSRPGWTEERYYHHATVEDGYVLHGSMVYNYGRLVPGAYFYRPAWVKHGLFRADPVQGCTILLRSNGYGKRWCTVDPEVRVFGHAENYDPETEAPTIAGIPVRSSSAGEWDGVGR